MKCSTIVSIVFLCIILLATTLYPSEYLESDKPVDLVSEVVYRFSKWPVVKALASYEFTTNAYKMFKCTPDHSWGATEMDHHISLITDGLYLGDVCAAHSLSTMKKHNIAVIVNMCINCHNELDQEMEVKHFGIRDDVDEKLDSVLDSAVRYIADRINKGEHVFLHCKAGISRSGAIAIAYVMYKNGWTYENAFEYVRTKRSVVNPNKGFTKTLSEYKTYV